MNLRVVAAHVVCEVLAGHSLTEVLPKMLKKVNTPRDQAFVQAICYGVCRWYDRLDNIVQHLLSKPLKEKDKDIYCLLLIGLYQLIEMRIPEHAAVSETVSAVQDFKKIWAKNLVNAVLRNFIRQRDELLKKTENNLSAFYSHPAWIIAKVKAGWPTDWQAILTANNQHPPFSLRVNQRHITRSDYLTTLPETIKAHIIPETQSGISLVEPIDVGLLPGFAAGDVSVQDGAAQLAAELLELSPAQRVLDACAAPGSKTAHILEVQSDIELLAIDVDAKRLQSVRDNLIRLKLSASCVNADVGDVPSWWDGKLFDRILLDAPCSASGVIRRHPDIKLLRRETDIAKLAMTQLHLLSTLWTVLGPGGMLVYATCSIFPEENIEVIKTFLASHPEAKEEKITATWGKECLWGRQVLPGMHGMDGFYYVCLRKTLLG
jgi:16S rRNA (cytosine967-C5)-methyltransferase